MVIYLDIEGSWESGEIKQVALVLQLKENKVLGMYYEFVLLHKWSATTTQFFIHFYYSPH